MVVVIFIWLDHLHANDLETGTLKTCQDLTNDTALYGIGFKSVSYTHLDVYKRQDKFFDLPCLFDIGKSLIKFSQCDLDHLITN